MQRWRCVVRRVGGLEDERGLFQPELDVVRRVGGLEVLAGLESGVLFVVRRVGGLEGPLVL